MNVAIAFVAGLTSGFFLVTFLLKRNIQNEKRLNELVYKVYHKDFNPYLARIEGLFNLFKIERDAKYIDMAINEIRLFKNHLKGILKE